MKLKQHIRKILAIILFLNLILSSLLPVCRLSLAVSDLPDSDKNGKEANICLYGLNKINGLWRYTKVNYGQNGLNAQLEANLYCAQKGAHVSTYFSFKVEGYNWKQNVLIFKDEESYKKITWIKNNFWEYIGQNEQDKFTMEEKFKILNSQNSEITEEDVQNVYSNENEIFKLYQMIIWKYTKAFGDWTDADLENMVASSNESTRKIYSTIIGMANKYYNSYEETPIIEVKETETITEVTNGECKWGIEINNTSILPYTMELTVNGQSYNNYTYENNVLTIKGLDNNESYVFSVSAKSAYVKCEGEVWITEKDDRQNMLEITEGKKSEIINSISTNLDVKPEGEFKVVINKKDTENNPLEGVTFDITGEYTGQVTTAKINDEMAMAIIDEKSIEKADQIYTYTIKELSTKDNMYTKLQDPVTINLVSGIEKSRDTGKFYYCIKEAKFENGSTEKDVLLDNGKILRISLTKNTESKDESFLTTVSLNLQNEKKIFDLALTKTIVKMDDEKISRENFIDTTQLNKTEEDTTAKYYLDKSPLEVKKSSIVSYKITVYNEGDIDAQNIEITDYIPDELEICDENGNTQLSADNTITIDGKYVWSVSNENGKTVAKTKIQDTIQAWDKSNLKSLFVVIYCKIKDGAQSGDIVYNVAEITSAEDTEGTKKIEEGDDRDSKPDTLTKDNTIEDYKNRYVDKKQNTEIKDEKNIDKSKYNYQDDDDFEVIKVVNKSLDLSLRKSITKIGTDSTNMTEVVYGEEYIDRKIYGPNIENIDRLPYIRLESGIACSSKGNGEYYHKKESVDVNKGDFVEYSIRIYNEGQNYDTLDNNIIQDYAGYAKEITDYLPEGLEFYALVNNDNNTWCTEESNYKTNESIYEKTNRSYGSYEADYDKEENTVRIKYIPGNIALQPSNYLMKIYGHNSAALEDAGYYNPQYCPETNISNKPEQYYMYQEIKMICKVKDDAKDNAILTNLAEITDYAAVEELEDGTLQEQEGVTDKDSSPNITITNDKTNLKSKRVNLNTYYEDKDVDDNYIEFYAGLEDDDDFENVQVIPTPPGTPEIHKGVKDIKNQDSGYNGDEEHDWVIQTSIPTKIRQFTKYIVTDKIDERLVFSGVEKVTVKIGERQLVANKDYKVSYDEKDRMLKIAFIEGNFVPGQSFEENSIIEIRFKTTFAKDENGNIIALNQEVPNKATLIYDNGSGKDEEKESEEPEVHTGAVAVYKYNEKTKEALKGAKFKIATSKENAQKGNFVKDTKGKDLEAISNDKGIAIFAGLEFGGDAYKNEANKKSDGTYSYDFENAKATYYIVETEAPEGFNKYEGIIEVEVSKDTTLTEIKNMKQVANTPIGKFDLALRKYISKVEDKEITSRIPVFKVDENGNYIYNHDKEPVLVGNQNAVEYTIRVYNEGTVNGYAKEIKDDIPEGLEFLPDDETNKEYRWIMLDADGNETDDASKAKYIISDYLSMENEETKGENLLKAFDEEAYEAGSIKEPDYKEVKVAFKVTMPNTSNEIIINQAQISDDSDEDGNDVTDKDSTPNKWIDGEDDQDIEKIKVQYFDLALRKWVTKAIVIENGVETITETGHKAEDDPEAVVKVDLKKSKLDKVVVKFEYQIRVTNEGQIAGSVEEISDYIPQGLKFVAADNPEWEEVEGKVVTDQLAGQIIQPGESKEVTILLTWINREDNMGLKVNVAEISKDYNEYGSPDIDSTPNNQVPGEDDIDDAPVMLTVTTGQAVMYIGITIAVLGILAGGVIGIKKFVIK